MGLYFSVKCYKRYIWFDVITTHTFTQLIITQGVFADQLKIANVIPIFKSGDSATMLQHINDRPVSVLFVFLKSFWTCYVC